MVGKVWQWEYETVGHMPSEVKTQRRMSAGVEFTSPLTRSGSCSHGGDRCHPSPPCWAVSPQTVSQNQCFLPRVVSCQVLGPRDEVNGYHRR